MSRVYITASHVHGLLHTKTLRSLRTLVRKTMKWEADFKGSAATRHGNRHEMEAIRLYERREGVFVRADQRTHYHPQHKWLGATPDFHRNSAVIGEVKCPYSDQSPPEQYIKKYMHQMQCQMLVTGARFCDFVLFRNGDLHVTRVAAAPDWAKNVPLLEAKRDQIRDIVRILGDPLHQQHAEYMGIFGG